MELCDQCPSPSRVTISKTDSEGKPLKLRLCGTHTRHGVEKLLTGGWNIQVDEGASVFIPEIEDSRPKEPATV